MLLIQDAAAERHRQDQQAHQERLAATERLAAGIANEFHPLLLSIVGYAELLQMQLPHSKAAQDDLEVIVKWGASRRQESPLYARFEWAIP